MSIFSTIVKLCKFLFYFQIKLKVFLIFILKRFFRSRFFQPNASIKTYRRTPYILPRMYQTFFFCALRLGYYVQQCIFFNLFRVYFKQLGPGHRSQKSIFSDFYWLYSTWIICWIFLFWLWKNHELLRQIWFLEFLNI
jgi:hypothetical protein